MVIDPNESENFLNKGKKTKLLIKGVGASPGIVIGRVKLIIGSYEAIEIQNGDIIVTRFAQPDLTIALFKASGVITDYGGTTSHVANIAREMGIPCVVGTQVATNMLNNDQIVLIDGSKGIVSLISE